MTEPVFVDTNVLLYALDNTDRSKQQAAQKWRTELWKSRMGRISFQVLSEFFVNAVRIRPDASDEARHEIRNLLTWRPVVTDHALLELGWAIQDQYRLSYWDSLIVAAARTASCSFLLTEDLQDGQVIDGVKVISPFSTNPENLT